MDLWVIWSEEHGAWWRPGSGGYTRSLRLAGRYTEEAARHIEARANFPTLPPEFHEIAMPDPMPAFDQQHRTRSNPGTARDER
jgi:hypothetical protein